VKRGDLVEVVTMPGTPMEGNAPPTGLDIVRCVATARVLMPASVVRLSAGRKDLSPGDQALAFLAGANSVFDGDKLLTTANADRDDDAALVGALGLKSRPAFLPYGAGGETSRGGAVEGGAAAQRAHA
jgi:biotin synthase